MLEDDDAGEGLSSLTKEEHDLLVRESEDRLRRSVLGEKGENPREPRLERIELGLIDPNPENPRKTFQRIGDLAATIEGLGLLQNLVVVRRVVPHLQSEPGGVPGSVRFLLRSGERRLRAMRLLVEKGRPGWTLEKKIPCLVLGRESIGELEALVENVQRQDLPPWEEGARFARIIEGCGLTAQEIGKQIGKSRSYVNLLVRIARGLSPKIIPILSRIGGAGPNLTELDALAGLTDKDTMGPDHDKQRKWLENFLTVDPKKRRRKNKTRKNLEDRLHRLEEMDMPETVRAIVDAIVKYLDGEEFVLPEFARKAGAFVREEDS